MAEVKEEAKTSEAQKAQVARKLRIQSIPESGKQSDTFDRKVRWETNQPAIKVQRGIAGAGFRRDELLALQRIMKPGTERAQAGTCRSNERALE